MIIFEKISQVNFKLTVDSPENSDELQSLAMQFVFEHPDRFNMPKFKSEQWDGKIRFIKFIDRLKEEAIAPIGLFNKYYKYLKLTNTPFEIIDDEMGIEDINLDDFDEFINDFHPKDKDKRAYQIDAVRNALILNRSVLESPTGSGKSLDIYLFMQWLITHDLEEGEKILLVVPTIDLVKQMANDLIGYGMNPKIIKKIFNGEEKDFSKPVVISTWQSLQRYPAEFFVQFDCLIVDECHKAKANKMMFIAESCINARWRLGTTGTLHNKKFLKYQVLANFGPVFRTSTTEGLIKQSYLTDFHIKHIILQWKKQGRVKRFDIETFQDEYDAILNNKERKAFIIDFVKNLWDNREYENSSLLLLGKRVDYIEDIFLALNEIYPKETYLIHGKIKSDIREVILNRIKKKGGLVVANVDIMGTGVNIPNIDGIVMINPIKSDILLVQSIGRSIRLYENKKFAMIYDLVDSIPIKGKTNSVLLWLDDKISIYRKLKYKFDIVEQDLIMQNENEISSFE
jgi:superfamily II DNA or RNA helicase